MIISSYSDRTACAMLGVTVGGGGGGGAGFGHGGQSGAGKCWHWNFVGSEGQYVCPGDDGQGCGFGVVPTGHLLVGSGVGGGGGAGGSGNVQVNGCKHTRSFGNGTRSLPR